MPTRKTLVLDTGTAAGQAVVRSLGRRGVSVVAGGSSAATPGMLSRFSDRRYVHPDPEPNYGRFLDHLYAHLRETDYDAVFDPGDATSIRLSRHRERLEATGTLVAVEAWPTRRTVADRSRLIDRLATVVPTPATHAPADPAAVESLAPELSYPVVVVPRRRTVWHPDGRCIRRVPRGAHRAAGPAELAETYRSVLAASPVPRERPPLVQERVSGERVAAVVLAEAGDVRAAFQASVVRAGRDDGSPPSLLESIDDPTVLEHAASIVDELSWTGPVQLEFVERPDGEVVLVDATGRYTEVLPFAVRCGIDLPWLHYRHLLGESVTHDGDYRTGVRWQRTRPDLAWTRGELSRGRVGAVGSFCLELLRADHALAPLSDPLGSLGSLLTGRSGGPRREPRPSRPRAAPEGDRGDVHPLFAVDDPAPERTPGDGPRTAVETEVASD